MGEKYAKVRSKAKPMKHHALSVARNGSLMFNVPVATGPYTLRIMEKGGKFDTLFQEEREEGK